MSKRIKKIFYFVNEIEQNEKQFTLKPPLYSPDSEGIRWKININ